MLFNSYIFICVFFPLTMVLWYGFNIMGRHRLAQLVLACLSLCFYGYGHPSYIVLILSSVAVNWLVSLCIAKIGEERVNYRRLLGLFGILFNVGLLFYFKYYDFFFSNMNRFLPAQIPLRHIALPLGISFFTFQQIGFMADRMTGQACHYKLIDYLNYVTFFPQLVAGPIVAHTELVPQFRKIGAGEHRLLDKDDDGRGVWDDIESGLRLLVLGLAKKVLLADRLGVLVDAGYGAVASLDALAALAVMLGYTLQIYLDFGGYCDMALGLARMLRIRLPRNFDSPYRAASIGEFWNRWHMTLNEFFTRYIYIPLGGSRRGTARLLFNIMIVFLISGVWHGAAWSFILWGVAHGLLRCLEQLPLYKRLPVWLRWGVTFLFINLAWVLFRSGSLGTARLFYQRLFSFSGVGIQKVTELAGGAKSLALLLAIMFASLVISLRREAYVYVEEKASTRVRMCVLAAVFALCVVSLSGVTAFLYFNF